MTIIRQMPKRAILLVLALLLLAGCASSHNATVTAAGTGAIGPSQALGDSTSTTAISDSSSSTTTGPAPTSTTVVTTSTTTAPAPTTTTQKPLPSTTTTTFPAGAIRLTIVNEHPRAVDVGVNGHSYTVQPAQRLGPVPVIPRADRNDAYSAVVHGTQCGTGDSSPFFQKPPGSSMTMRLVPEGTCDPAGPGVPNLNVVLEG